MAASRLSAIRCFAFLLSTAWTARLSGAGYDRTLDRSRCEVRFPLESRRRRTGIRRLGDL